MAKRLVSNVKTKTHSAANSSKNRTGKIVLLVFLILGIGLMTIFASGRISNSSGQYQVELREDGFYPPSLTIEKGSMVTFTTKLSSFFWPASNFHPSHDLYPEFDPKVPVDPKGNWTFQFSRVGSWDYHDHLSPYFKGIIQVIETTGTTPKQVSGLQCVGLTGQVPIDCRKAELLVMLEKEGLDRTFQQIEEFYKNDQEFLKGCHGVAHDLGVASYNLYKKDKDSVLSPRTSYCANGFYHGFMEAFLGATKSIELSRQFCLYVDAKLTDQAPDAYLQCFHGIGHGSIEFTLGEGRRPSSNEAVLIKPALDLCEKASQKPEELYRCTSGAFNGVANMYISGEYGLDPREEDPLWICKIQPDKYKESCYGNMNSYLMWQSKNDFKEALKFVSVLTDGHAEMGVNYLAGMAAASNLLGFDLDKISASLQACRDLAFNLKDSCLKGLAQGYLEHGTPALEYRDAIKFCRLDLLTDIERQTCFTFSLGGLHGWYSREKVFQICQEIDPNLYPYCRTSLL